MGLERVEVDHVLDAVDIAAQTARISRGFFAPRPSWMGAASRDPTTTASMAAGVPSHVVICVMSIVSPLPCVRRQDSASRSL